MNLSVANGSFFYQKDTPIFQNINFSVDSGEILAILGPNGAGKTTMLQTLAVSLALRYSPQELNMYVPALLYQKPGREALSAISMAATKLTVISPVSLTSIQ